ncbi:MAG: 50S ribosomal protein L23 [Mycoplasmataceae bacterium]|jgi:large subunit ribosomal protein L23|nr:50S ribosomal protein L23 [Mycoplasmataceae bacterium]
MEFTRIILRPIHTEKTYTFVSLPQKKYAFIVDVKATKHDISIAFESIYGIHPLKIATQIRKPVEVRTGTLKPGYSKLTKIAYITLPEGSDIATSNKEPTKDTTPTTKTTVAKTTESKKDITKKEITKPTTTVEEGK